MSNQITVRIDSRLAKELRQACRRLGVRPSDVVRTALRQFFHPEAGTHGNTPYGRARHLIGKVATGVPDLAEKHREYLVQSLRRGSVRNGS